MSEPENFLDRWSRRKQQATNEPAPVEAQDAAAVPPPETKAGAPVFDPASLPPLDSITADTDIGAFLKPGVPSALKHAALRRAWSADPQIRDFIGLVENGWNWNDPAGVPGFGPMPEGEDIGRLLAQAMGTLLPEPAAARGATVAQVNSVPAQDEGAPKQNPATKDSELVQHSETDAAPQNDSDLSQDENDSDSLADENAPLVRRRGHGGALPK